MMQRKQTHFPKWVIKCLVKYVFVTASNTFKYCYNIFFLFHCFLVLSALYVLWFQEENSFLRNTWCLSTNFMKNPKRNFKNNFLHAVSLKNEETLKPYTKSTIPPPPFFFLTEVKESILILWKFFLNIVNLRTTYKKYLQNWLFEICFIYRFFIILTYATSSTPAIVYVW